MTAKNTSLDSITAGTRNAELAFDLVQAQLANPDLLAEIPNGATVVLIPEDDADLAEYNFGVARTLVARGKDVYLKRVRSAAPAPAP